MWEPIINWSENDVQERYKDAVLTKDARSALKKALGTWGVDVHSEEMEREFDHRAGKYVYSNVGTMNFGNCFMMDYTVNDDGNTLTFGKGAMASWNNLSDVYVNRAMNAILYHMDISLVRRSVEQDRVHVFTEDVLSRFTLAQIPNSSMWLWRTTAPMFLPYYWITRTVSLRISILWMRFRWNGKRLHRANYCDNHFALNRELLFYERQREIIREIEELDLED